ncbi:MAG: hypothetical protein QM768_12345 [Agriterribacter sp.]
MHTISFLYTHVYPGCTAIYLFTPADGATVAAMAEFSDGATATAVIEQVNPAEVLVHIDAYHTARGTRISKKT